MEADSKIRTGQHSEVLAEVEDHGLPEGPTCMLV